MNKLDIQERASAKAFANITSCNIDIRQLSEEIKLYGSQYPFITKEQNEKVLDRLKTCECMRNMTVLHSLSTAKDGAGGA